jgi:hypothetical protein
VSRSACALLVATALVQTACSRADRTSGERPVSIKWELGAEPVQAFDYRQSVTGMGHAGPLDVDARGTMFVRRRGPELADVLVTDLHADGTSPAGAKTRQKLPDLLIERVDLGAAAGRADENDWTARLLLALPRRPFTRVGEDASIPFDIPIHFLGTRFTVTDPLTMSVVETGPCDDGGHRCVVLAQGLEGESRGLTLDVSGRKVYDLTARQLARSELWITLTRGDVSQDIHAVLVRTPADDAKAPR